MKLNDKNVTLEPADPQPGDTVVARFEDGSGVVLKDAHFIYQDGGTYITAAEEQPFDAEAEAVDIT